ncbi:hypothetical protein HBN50_17305 [Halobacteriovorax sp. GB3]|uniref:hypothetical protein n=1 Tax=Halobacteriovorax sp. GB3 TaxID=2719615 RepID=UPI0023618DB0|nr:hypothetical protein [Halobacteriovorax sp. GB3]MDD0854865.1 hypothetical protein [Halobacteriovorax sp. GB3]
MKILFVLLFVSVSANASLYNFYFPSEGKQQFSISAFGYEEEREFERDSAVVEELNYEGGGIKIGYGYFIKGKYFLGLEFDYLIKGEYQERFSEDLESLPDGTINVHGFREPTLIFRNYFEHSMDQHYFHGLHFTYNPKIFNAHQSNYASGRHEASLGYWFSYRRPSFEFAGEIYTKVYGRKRVDRRLGGQEITGNFSEVGIDLKPGFITKHFAFHLLGGTSNTTDYNTRNKDFARLSDKGFTIYGGLSLTYGNPQFKIVLESIAKSYVFNSIEEDLSREVDFEYETKYTTLKLEWLF